MKDLPRPTRGSGGIYPRLATLLELSEENIFLFQSKQGRIVYHERSFVMNYPFVCRCIPLD